jgi:hypothetical protein
VELMYREQKGLCGLYHKPVEFPRRTKSGIDHCHKTKRVRAIIHYKCNILLGMANDDISMLAMAIEYLLKHSGTEVLNAPYTDS